MIDDKIIITQELIASNLRRLYNLKPIGSRKCFISIFPDGKQILWEQRIEIVFIPSSLGKGHIALLVCPISAKRCRRLHLINDVYQYNLNQKDFYYLQNPLKHKQPAFYKACLSIQANKELSGFLDKPYSKTHYKGKVTKRYLKTLKKAQDFHGMTMFDLINGKLDYLRKGKSW